MLAMLHQTRPAGRTRLGHCDRQDLKDIKYECIQPIPMAKKPQDRSLKKGLPARPILAARRDAQRVAAVRTRIVPPPWWDMKQIAWAHIKLQGWNSGYVWRVCRIQIFRARNIAHVPIRMSPKAKLIANPRNRT